MSKIKVMPEQLSNRIAAGEVIERPASVVKELVENAIDAGAKRIRIEIERAGSRLICVSDDGSGMDADDALLCLEPHGTSKLFTEKEIDHITTLGFRGEALPSIASVSRFTVTTRTADSPEGVSVKVEGGKFLGSTPAAGAIGTTMLVRDLFYNTPARRKFLRSPATESHHIEEMVIAMALPRWEVGFELRLDGRLAFNSPGASTPAARIREFFGKQFAENMWPVDHVENNMHITGFIAAPGFTRNSRHEQRTFVNRRPIEAPAIYRGLKEGYATLTDAGRYAPAILFIEMPPEDVDVNVHPAKREVRFKYDYSVSRAVTAAVNNALKRSRESSPAALREPSLPITGRVPLDKILDTMQVHYTPKDTEQGEFELTPVIRNATPPETVPEPVFTPPEPPEELPPGDPAYAAAQEEPPVAETEPETEKEEVPEVDFSERFNFKAAPYTGGWPTEILGILDNTYILAAGPQGLIMIDQHAAHERIMFEKLLEQARKGAAAQPLLLPQMVELPRSHMGLMLKYRHIFEKLGFDVEPMGNTSLMINALPLDLRVSRPLSEVFPDMLQELLENSENKIPVDGAYVARAACRSAIKAHETLPPEGAAELLRQLGECQQGTLCPHGRPTLININYNEIEKRFGRR